MALNPFGKAIIFEDRSINLQRVLRTQPADAAAAQETPKPKPQANQPPAFPVAVERVRIVGADARGQAMREELIRQGLDSARVSLAAPKEQAVREKFAPSKMSLGAGKRPAVESVPAGAPATATP